MDSVETLYLVQLKPTAPNVIVIALYNWQLYKYTVVSYY